VTGEIYRYKLAGYLASMHVTNSAPIVILRLSLDHSSDTRLPIAMCDGIS
jgi:hypothetical protein